MLERVLITGGGGMLGRNLCDYLAGHSYDVVSPKRDELDYLDCAGVKDYLKTHNFDLVIHCAGKVGGVSANIRSPQDFFFENVQVGLNVLKACSDVGVSRVINIGSINSLAADESHVVSESGLLTAELESSIQPYGLAKGVIARYAQYLSDALGVHYKTVFLPNLFGKYDKFGRDAHLIPSLIDRFHRAKARDSASEAIWGDGKARRTAIYATDVCRFLYSVLIDFEKLPQLYLLSGQEARSVLEYNEIVAKVVGYEGSFTFDVSKPVGVHSRDLVSNHPDLYRHDYTVLETSIREVYEYYLEEVCSEN